MTTAQTARRAAGTQTGLDVLLRWMWIRRRTSAQDIEDFRNGKPILVVGFSQTIGGEVLVSVGKGKKIARLRQGYLRLAGGDAPIWTDRRGGRSARLQSPFSLRSVPKKVRLAPKFEGYELVTSQGVFDLAVPKKDAALVQYAFAPQES